MCATNAGNFGRGKDATHGHRKSWSELGSSTPTLAHRRAGSCARRDLRPVRSQDQPFRARRALRFLALADTTRRTGLWRQRLGEIRLSEPADHGALVEAVRPVTADAGGVGVVWLQSVIRDCV